MTKAEKHALIDYLEFHLLTFCEQLEPHIDPDSIGMLYAHANNIVQDIKTSIATDTNEIS